MYVWYGEVTRKLNSRLPPYVLLAQSCPILCNPSDCSLLGSSVHGILQERILEWVAISFSRGSSQPRDRTQLSPIASRFFTIWAPREAPGYPQISSIGYRSTDLRTMSTKVICSLSFMVEPKPEYPLTLHIIHGKTGICGAVRNKLTNCKFLKVKVTQSYPTLCDPTDYSLPGSSVHGILQARMLEIFPTQGPKPGSLHCRQILYRLRHQGSPIRFWGSFMNA